jgi:uncharacterized protein with ParB-like and HNH nuclease domain
MDHDDFDDFDENDEDNEWYDKEQERKKKMLKEHPLYKQSGEIMDLLETMRSVVEEGSIKDLLDSLVADSRTIFVKLSSAIQMENFLISMQNASIIRDLGHRLRVANHSLSWEGDFDEKYVKVFREEMDRFLVLFREWVSTFDELERDVEDEWGLFK